MNYFKESFLVNILIRVKKILPKQYLKQSYVISLLLLVSSVLELLGLAALIPVFGAIFDNKFIEKNAWAAYVYELLNFTSYKQFIVFVAVILVIMIVVKNMLLTLINYKQNQFVFEVYRNISQRLHRTYYQRGHDFLKNTNSNILQRDLIGAPTQFSSGILLMLINLINELLIVCILMIGVLIYDYKVSLLLIITVVPITIFFYKKAKKRLQIVNKETKATIPDLNKQIFETIYGYQDIRILGVEEHFFTKVGKPQNKMVEINVIKGLFTYIPTRIIETGLMLAVALIVIYGTYNFDSNQEIISLIGVFAIAGYRILPSLNRILTSILSIQSVQYTIDIVSQISELKEDSVNKTNSSKNYDFDQIELKNVFFKYSKESNYIIKGISMDINKGENIGIIGKSGAGKSTLMNILLSYLKPSMGDILIDGKEIGQFNDSALLKLMGYVSQDVYIIDDTLEKNIAFGINDEDIDKERIKHVVDISQLTSFVNELPQRLQTKIGERGASISGGQRQRVGIARALYSGAKILLFDEATSSLDNETEKDVTDAIYKLKTDNITSIIIAHRYSSLIHCDKIYEIENGILNSVDLKTFKKK